MSADSALWLALHGGVRAPVFYLRTYQNIYTNITYVRSSTLPSPYITSYTCSTYLAMRAFNTRTTCPSHADTRVYARLKAS
jgi:hypothetical protein